MKLHQFAFGAGYLSLSAYDNPYWKHYPNKTTLEDEICARAWVDGYVQRIIDNRKSSLLLTEWGLG